MSRDPYRVLGVAPGASSEELHNAYRRLVKLHHPDRNGGSAESTRRFQEIQAAYEQIGRARAEGPGPAAPPPPHDDFVETRIDDLEREVREAHAAREAARRAAREATRTTPERPSDEELGYVTTDDSFGKIISDVVDELADGLAGARRHPAAQRLADLIDRLENREKSGASRSMLDNVRYVDYRRIAGNLTTSQPADSAFRARSERPLPAPRHGSGRDHGATPAGPLRESAPHVCGQSRANPGND